MTQQQEYRHLRRFTTPLFTSNLLCTAYTSKAFDHFFPSTSLCIRRSELELQHHYLFRSSAKSFPPSLHEVAVAIGVEIPSPKSISIPEMGDGLVEYFCFEPSQERRNSLLLGYASGREVGTFPPSSMILAVGPLVLMLRWTHARFGGPQNGDGRQLPRRKLSKFHFHPPPCLPIIHFVQCAHIILCTYRFQPGDERSHCNLNANKSLWTG
ncbi:hypothetical protein ARMGADRAFT_574252 [Armillaria gallica]|uniref:Uncharacterized protein n=1 Tax=Armillaria gallica TaxID=47427 RepID=A0A2H3ECZ4_ARMGA|nr:hypothetical protein ARMGADRAFT_574252 [Armillaria gallica]